MTGASTEACWIAVNSLRWIGEPGHLAAVLDALEASPHTEIDRCGPDERRLTRYTRKSVLDRKPRAPGREWFLMLVRDRAPRIDGSAASVTGTKLLFGFKTDGLVDACRPAFELADELAARTRPQLVAVTPQYERRDPKEGEDAETIDWIIESGEMYEPNLRNNGLLGLAPRTYLGPDVVELIGRQRIEALTLPRRWFDDGGVRLDLIEEPWRARPEDLVAPWRAAMAVLRESEVFSTGYVTSPNGTVVARRGKRWP